MIIARAVQEIIGTPAGAKGVKESARRIAKPASTQDLRSESLGQSSPRNAAGTAASKPQADGSPIDCAPSAPASVNRFQKMNTPKPVYQILYAFRLHLSVQVQHQ